MSQEKSAQDAHPGSPMTGQAVMDREYLEMRALVLRLAASFDRMDRSSQPEADPEKMDRLKKGVQILLEQTPDRAAAVQKLFSLDYQSDWHQKFGLTIEKS